MASAVTYNIKGKYDGKATKQAKSDFKSLGESVKSISGIIKGLAVVKAVQTLSKVANATKGVFMEQNKALTNFNTAVAKSNIEINKLNNLKSKISHGNFIDDDSINNAMALGLQMGLNEEQLNKVMTASSELASAGVMPLDQAVKTLSQSYTGQTGQLGKLLPQVKDLTKQELAQGDAVDLVLDKYEGYADAMSNTFSGRNTQWNNAISDLKAAIGSIPTSLQFMGEGKLLEHLNKVTQWITDNRNYIINFFLHLPEVAQTVFSNIKSIFSKTWENLPEIVSNIGPLLTQTARDAFSTFVDVAKAAFEGIGTLLDHVIGNPFRNSKDFINNLLNNIIEGINGLADKLPKWIKKLFGDENGNLEVIKYRFSTNNADKNDTWAETIKGIQASIEKASASYKDGTKKVKDDWLKVLNSTTTFYKDDIDRLKSDLESVLGQDLPEDLQKALNGITYTPSGAVTITDNDGLGGDTKETSIKDTILSSTGEIGSLIKAYIDDGWKGVVVELISKIAGILSSASEIISDALNAITYFFNQVLPPIIKILENWLAPILVFIRQIGEILRDVFNMLEPILSAIGSNLIKTVLSVIITILDLIYNAVVAVHNIFTSDSKDWSYRSLKDDTNAIWDSSSSYDTASAITSSNASSSYSQARDIYVNIIYNNSYVNGDADAIALNIRDRIREAESMGY